MMETFGYLGRIISKSNNDATRMILNGSITSMIAAMVLYPATLFWSVGWLFENFLDILE